MPFKPKRDEEALPEDGDEQNEVSSEDVVSEEEEGAGNAYKRQKKDQDHQNMLIKH